jgi:integrase
LPVNLFALLTEKLIGKGQISLTLDTYSHVLPSMQEEAAEKLDILLTPISISVGQSKYSIEK